MKKILFLFSLFFGILLAPQIAGAAGSCCVYIGLKAPGDAPTEEIECVDSDFNPVGTKVDVANNFACPSGSAPETIDAAFFVYTLEFTEDKCPLLGSDYQVIVTPKENLYCQRGIAALRAEPDDTALYKTMFQIIGNAYAAHHNVSFAKTCCLPIDKQTYPDLECKLPKLKEAEVYEPIRNYFFSTAGGLEPTPPADTKLKDFLTCDPGDEKYQIYPYDCNEKVDRFSMSAAPIYYQKSGFPNVTMYQLCKGSFSYSSPQPEEKTYLPADEKKEEEKKEEEKKEEEQKIVLPSAAVLNQLPDTSPQKFFSRMIKFFLGVIGSLALAMTVLGGFLWMSSMGNAERKKKAQSIIVWASLGVIVMLSSYILLSFIFEAVE